MRFRMDDDTIVDTDRADDSWNEDTRWNGQNRISVNTGSQWHHETLYRSAKGRYYIVGDSDWQGSIPEARWASPQEAARWLLLNDHELPESLGPDADAVSE